MLSIIKAYEIGIQLGVPNSKLLQFNAARRKSSGAITGLLAIVCGNVPNVPITWGSVVAVPNSKQVGERGCAEAISSKIVASKRIQRWRERSVGSNPTKMDYDFQCSSYIIFVLGYYSGTPHLEPRRIS